MNIANFTPREYLLMRFAACREGALHWRSLAKIFPQAHAVYMRLARSDAELARSYWRSANAS